MTAAKRCFYCGQAIADTPVRRPAVRRPDGTVLYYAYQHPQAPACCPPAAGALLPGGPRAARQPISTTHLGG